MRAAEELRRLKGVGDAISVAYSADGQWIAAGTRGGKVRLWRVAPPAESFTIPSRPRPATDARIHSRFQSDSRWPRPPDGNPGHHRPQNGQLSGIILSTDRALAFSQDSRALASANAAGERALDDSDRVRQRVSLACTRCGDRPRFRTTEIGSSVGRDSTLIVASPAPLGEPPSVMRTACWRAVRKTVAPLSSSHVAAITPRRTAARVCCVRTTRVARRR
jgi:hypothetical protein